MRFGPDKELFDFLTNGERSSEPMRMQVGERLAIDGCYYEGVQWINRFYGAPAANRSATLNRLVVDWRPEAQKLRAVCNMTSMLTQKKAASTHPDVIDLDSLPPERDTGPDAAFRARVHETTAIAFMDDAKYVAAAQLANHRRCIFGVWGMGLCVEGGEQGSSIRAFDFDPTALILDPACQALDLCDHPHVTYRDTWTLDRIERAFGIKILPENAKTFEQLEAQKIEMNALSMNKLFTRYARNASTKGAVVYQVHMKEGPYRFPYWYVVIEDGKGQKIRVDQDDATPFGGAGMPLMLLHAYYRADTMWSWGEPAQIKDEQDKANLGETLYQRIMQAYAHHKVVVDRRAYGSNPNDDSIKDQWNNQIGGTVILNMGDRVRNIMPPQILPMPAPPPFLADAIDRHLDRAQKKTHKAPGNFGIAKSHVPDSTNQRIMDDADKVDSVRVNGDVRRHEYLIGVLHATGCKLVQDRDPMAALTLRRQGFDKQDYAVVIETDIAYPNVTLKVKEGSFRHQSAAAKKQNLDTAAQLQMIAPDDYRLAMADYQMPITDDDRHMTDVARREALEIIYGAEWLPRPLGKWAKRFIDEFTRAQFDRRAKADPSAIQRLVGAIQAVYSMSYQEQALAAGPGAGSAGGGTPAEQQAGPQIPETASVADILGALSQGGGAGVSAQPATAA